MSDLMRLLVIYLIIMNTASFLMYGADKLKAKRNSWRIPENALLMCALLGGAYGAWLGMNFFHHKTKHTSFRITNGISVILWTALIGWCLYQGI